MEFRNTSIQGLIEIYPKILGDERGYFYESYQKEKFYENGVNFDFIQDNQSFSAKGVLRGLHMQHEPNAQGKLVKVLKGKVLDVAVDIRLNSPTFGKHEKVVLDADLGNMLFVPPGFLHGFLTLEDAIFVYKCTNYYNKQSESGVLYNDSDLGIDWGAENPTVSEKDLNLISFENFKKQLGT